MASSVNLVLRRYEEIGSLFEAVKQQVNDFDLRQGDLFDNALETLLEDLNDIVQWLQLLQLFVTEGAQQTADAQKAQNITDFTLKKIVAEAIETSNLLEDFAAIAKDRRPSTVFAAATNEQLAARVAELGEPRTQSKFVSREDLRLKFRQESQPSIAQELSNWWRSLAGLLLPDFKPISASIESAGDSQENIRAKVCSLMLDGVACSVCRQVEARVECELCAMPYCSSQCQTSVAGSHRKICHQ